MSNKFAALWLVSLFLLAGCNRAQSGAPAAPKPSRTELETTAKIENPGKVIHVLVALCDNENQGIVPVPAALGDGEDPPKNLYWGAAYGVRTYFSKSANWQKIIEIANPKENVL